MKKTYLVKKDTTKENNADNWIYMNAYEFALFIQTPEGQQRKNNFAQLDACEYTDEIYVIECGTEKARQLRSEKDKADHRNKLKAESGITVISYNGIYDNDDEEAGEELLVDFDCNVVDDVLKKMTIEHFYRAFDKLNDFEKDIIMSLYLKKVPENANQIATRYGIARSTVYHNRDVAFGKIKKYFNF